MPLSDRARAELDELQASMELLSDDDISILAELWQNAGIAQIPGAHTAPAASLPTRAGF